MAHDPRTDTRTPRAPAGPHPPAGMLQSAFGSPTGADKITTRGRSNQP